MANIAITTTITAADPARAEIHAVIPNVATTAGQVLYLASTGKWPLATAAAAGTVKCPGIALDKAGTRQAVGLLKRGKVTGYAVSGLAYGALIYASDTAGSLADAAGTVSTVVGKVVPLSDTDLTKVIYFECNWLT